MTNTLLTLHDPEAARRYYAEGLWRADTLYTLLCDHAARQPDDNALRKRFESVGCGAPAVWLSATWVLLRRERHTVNRKRVTGCTSKSG